MQVEVDQYQKQKYKEQEIVEEKNKTRKYFWMDRKKEDSCINYMYIIYSLSLSFSHSFFMTSFWWIETETENEREREKIRRNRERNKEEDAHDEMSIRQLLKRLQNHCAFFFAFGMEEGDRKWMKWRGNEGILLQKTFFLFYVSAVIVFFPCRNKWAEHNIRRKWVNGYLYDISCHFFFWKVDRKVWNVFWVISVDRGLSRIGPREDYKNHA